jgi:hypothetical protein
MQDMNVRESDVIEFDSEALVFVAGGAGKADLVNGTP